MWLQNKELIRNAVIGCFAGIALGLLIYPYLSERMVLLLTGVLLLVGVATSLLPQENRVGPRGFQA
ncbi:hypothetical protein, partial [Ruegeria sp. SCP11]|uniref:hypothetical protein n=1 Tax=Ruegeria sp. SCP11 TaxID=3141378 RepID=UPI00333A90F3